MEKLLVIVGPTASGKSALGKELAQRFNGEIISADSRQVYRGLDIGTGKEKDFPQHLIDVADPSEDYNVSHFVADAKKAIEDIVSRGKLPIIVGGTGFWVDTLILGNQLPHVKPNKELRRELEQQSAAELFEKLQHLDAFRAKHIDKHNKRRLIRALEVAISGTPSALPLIDKGESEGVVWIGIKLPKEELQKRIEARIDRWIAEGLCEEAKKLSHPEKFGFMYMGLSRDEMVRSTMQYAKRQMTWFKRNKAIQWINPLDPPYVKGEGVEKLIREWLE